MGKSKVSGFFDSHGIYAQKFVSEKSSVGVIFLVQNSMNGEAPLDVNRCRHRYIRLSGWRELINRPFADKVSRYSIRAGCFRLIFASSRECGDDASLSSQCVFKRYIVHKVSVIVSQSKARKTCKMSFYQQCAIAALFLQQIHVFFGIEH